MRKLIYFISFVALISCGCVYKNHDHYEKIPTNTAIVYPSDFNNETYVWENINFSTNRVEKVVK